MQVEAESHRPTHDEAPAAVPLQDLSAEARLGGFEATLRSAGLLFRIVRALSRRSEHHVVLTGDRGVGRTTVLRLLARVAQSERHPQLRPRRFVRVDCRQASPDDGRSILAALFAQAAEHRNLVLCLDDLGSVLRRPDGRTNVPEFVAGLHRSRVPIIGVLTRWEYNDLLAGYADLRGLCTRIDVEEPDDEMARAILAEHAESFAADFGITIPEPLLDRTVALTSSYLLNERQPAKSIRVLRRACENAAFDRAATQFRGPAGDETTNGESSSSLNSRLNPPLTESALIDVVAEITGVPRETLAGESSDTDYEAALREAVVGQEDAIRIVANELRLIRGGLVSPGKPASVLLFAGLTGVGKTELAKRLAEIYSSSRRLNVYPMGNFTEPHSVSGIIGVPPGYVGHDAGGRLINELNADPYAVFLLDEAEKAHPNVWKPFLNLFDEGWIEDPRGVRAWGDRAIFILTTNAGSDHIAQMTQNAATETEIEERVKSTLARVKIERSAQPVFTPQFLSRIKRTLVFRPLDEDAMIGITRKLVGQVQRLWQQKRDQHLEIDDQLIEWIGRRAHTLNHKSGNKEGARIVRKLISDVVETRVQQELLGQPSAGRHHRTIRVSAASSPAEAATEAEPRHATGTEERLIIAVEFDRA